MVFGDSIYGCVDSQTFHNEGKSHFSTTIQNEAGEKDLLTTLEKYSTEVGYTDFGVLKSIDGVNEKLIMKIQNPISIYDIINVKRDIGNLKKMCGNKPGEVIKPFSHCNKSEVSTFKGCVEVKNTVYIFLRRGYSSLETTNMLDKFSSFDPIKRIVVFLNILDLVIGLHNKKIIHSDIKPASIVCLDSELQEFELTNLGNGGVEKSMYVGGTNYYFPPEVSPAFSERKLKPQIDVYSLAITMMSLEIDFEGKCKNIDPDCFKKNLDFGCHASIIEIVKIVLKSNTVLTKLTETFYQALSFYTNKRYATVENFSRDIVKSLSELPDFKRYLKKIQIEEERKAQLILKASKDLKDTKNLEESDATSKGYKWIKFAEELGLIKLPNISEKAAQNSIINSIQNPTNNKLVVDLKETGKDEYVVEDELIHGVGAQTLPKKHQAAKKPGRIFNDQVIKELSDEDISRINQHFPKFQLKCSKNLNFAHKNGNQDSQVQVIAPEIFI